MLCLTLLGALIGACAQAVTPYAMHVFTLATVAVGIWWTAAGSDTRGESDG